MPEGLPKSLVKFIRTIGIRTLDRLAETATAEGEPIRSEMLRLMVERWLQMSDAEREQLADQVTAAAGDVIAESTVLPAGLRLGKKAVKSARKVLRKKSRKMKKTIKSEEKESVARKKTKHAQKTR